MNAWVWRWWGCDCWMHDYYCSGLVWLEILCLLNKLDWSTAWIEWIGIIRSYALNKYPVIRRERTWIRNMVENVSWFDRLIVKVITGHNPVSVWSLNVRKQLTLSIDFCMNLLLLNECISMTMMKAMIDWNSYLAKKLTLCMNELSLAPMLSWKVDWLTWTLSLLIVIPIYLVLDCRRAS